MSTLVTLPGNARQMRNHWSTLPLDETGEQHKMVTIWNQGFSWPIGPELRTRISDYPWMDVGFFYKTNTTTQIFQKNSPWWKDLDNKKVDFVCHSGLRWHLSPWVGISLWNNKPLLSQKKSSWEPANPCEAEPKKATRLPQIDYLPALAEFLTVSELITFNCVAKWGRNYAGAWQLKDFKAKCAKLTANLTSLLTAWEEELFILSTRVSCDKPVWLFLTSNIMHPTIGLLICLRCGECFWTTQHVWESRFRISMEGTNAVAYSTNILWGPHPQWFLPQYLEREELQTQRQKLTNLWHEWIVLTACSRNLRPSMKPEHKEIITTLWWASWVLFTKISLQFPRRTCRTYRKPKTLRPPLLWKNDHQTGRDWLCMDF